MGMTRGRLSAIGVHFHDSRRVYEMLASSPLDQNASVGGIPPFPHSWRASFAGSPLAIARPEESSTACRRLPAESERMGFGLGTSNIVIDESGNSGRARRKKGHSDCYRSPTQ